MFDIQEHDGFYRKSSHFSCFRVLCNKWEFNFNKSVEWTLFCPVQCEKCLLLRFAQCSSLLLSALLFCSVLFSFALCSSVLLWALPFCSVLFSFALCSSVLLCALLFCSGLFCFALCSSICFLSINLSCSLCCYMLF